MRPPTPPPDALTEALRAAGCVFAEEEAALLRAAAPDAGRLEALTARRIAGEPLEHVLGVVEFMGMRLGIGPGAFVPRQRTRLLARWAVEAVRAAAAARGKGPPPVFVEAFAGVAPVAAAVQRAAPGAEVHATDLDDVVLERHARSNLSPTAGVHAGSVLEGLPAALRSRVDVIAAVPPYIPAGASELLPREARDHEPGAALYGGADGLDLVRAVLAQAPGWLRPGGRLLLEMNRGQCGAATESAGRLGYASLIRLGDDGQTAVLDLRAAAR